MKIINQRGGLRQIVRPVGQKTTSEVNLNPPHQSSLLVGVRLSSLTIAMCKNQEFRSAGFRPEMWAFERPTEIAAGQEVG
jgi:hypothetical protein